MEKITGIKSVDFKVMALGHGVVNWNGQVDVNALVNGNIKRLKNHSIPKLRGYSNKRFKDDGSYSLKFADEIDFSKNPLYISQNCIRHHLFREQAFDLQVLEKKENLNEEMHKLLCSLLGLVRGYVIPKTENKRTTALLITDFEEKLHLGNYEQMGRSGSKEKQATKSGTDKSTSMFSKTTFGQTKYEAHGSISIEQLQFISLDERFSRQAMRADESEAKLLAEKITDFIKSLATNGEQKENIKADYHPNYVRFGSIYNLGEGGILLNDDAIDVLVKQTLYLIENLSIRQAKGYMYVDEIQIDYNDSELAKDMMRIIRDESLAQQEKIGKYAVYFKGADK
jgi:hypothetical protein